MKYLSLLLALFTAVPAATRADELGTLFFTPEQRAQLDRQHEQNAGVDEGNSSVLTVNGIVQKEGGARTVWINGVPQAAGNSDKHDPASVPVSIPGQSKPVKIKVGQRLRLDDTSQPPDGSR